MKIYISADIEGITGVTHWDETELDKAEYQAAREQMTAEVAAACEAALQAGASEIWVKDAHDSARNLIAARLPGEARLIRGWAPSPLMMVQELDSTFQAVMMIGYHSRAGSGANPLSHTMSGSYTQIRLNGQPASEFLLHSYAAALHNVPVAMVTGDQGLCDEVAAYNGSIETVAVKQGVGNSTINIHPGLATARIREGVTRALTGSLDRFLAPLPAHFIIELAYRKHASAYQLSFYPGARLLDPTTVQFEADNFYEVMRFLLFAP